MLAIQYLELKYIKMIKKYKTLADIYEQVPPDYYEKGIQENLFQWVWHNWKWYSMRKILKKINPSPLTVLDVGCSSGHITSRLAELFPKSKITGIDTYKPVINLAKKIHPKIKFLQGDAHKYL
jgi:ubiquinone/menaquinone biosynthesis C-methylase UbiE